MSTTSAHPQLQIHLNALLPTLSPLPTPLLDLAASLLAQSRLRASTLKPEEEIARAFACCHIACERLGKKLALELEERNVRPPCKPRVYARLKAFLGSVLRTPAGAVSGGGGTPRTPRGRKAHEGVGGEEVSPTKRAAEEMERRTGRRRIVGVTTPSRSGDAVQTERDGDVIDVSTAVRREESTVERPEERDDDTDERLLPSSKRPAKTPLRRKEKHAKRNVSGDEEPGPAGLLPGLGTMFQPAVDWLSEERNQRYELWEKDIRRQLNAALQRTTAA